MKDQMIKVRTTEEVKEKLRILAEKDNRSMSNTITALIVAAFEEHKKIHGGLL